MKVGRRPLAAPAKMPVPAPAAPEPPVRFNWAFYRTALVIGLPVIISHLVSISLNMIDTMMIGRVGVDELSAVGAANRVYVIYATMIYGFFSGAAILISQYWGVKDVANIRRITGIEYIFAAGLALFTMLLTGFFPMRIIDLFSDEPKVIALGAEYLRIVLWSYLFTALSAVISFTSRCIHRLVWPTAISCLAVAVNTFFNYCLIYGNFGFPCLGVRGAAIATLMARVLEFALMAAYVYLSHDHPLAGRLREFLSFDRDLLRRVFRKAVPTTASEMAWSVGTSVYFVAFGKTGPSALAVAQACSVISDLSLSFFYGVGNACAVMIGNELGRRHKETAFAYAKHFIKIVLAICLVVTAVFYFSLPPIVKLYRFDPTTAALLYNTLLVYVIFTTPRSLTYTLMLGVLRAGGDATYCMILDVAGIWGLGVPLAFIGACALGWTLPAVVALTFIEEVIKTFICFRRLRGRKWASVLI